ncbi:MAG TPA: hypothetical protein VFF04_04330 [Candidatus Babeliales bacterium]|nr:hypothetical protein [Candidatus Babeliales bacterium]
MNSLAVRLPMLLTLATLATACTLVHAMQQHPLALPQVQNQMQQKCIQKYTNQIQSLLNAEKITQQQHITLSGIIHGNAHFFNKQDIYFATLKNILAQQSQQKIAAYHQHVAHA